MSRGRSPDAGDGASDSCSGTHAAWAGRSGGWGEDDESKPHSAACFFFFQGVGTHTRCIFFWRPKPAKFLNPPPSQMYDQVEIEDMTWSDELAAFTYACPCGDVFQITKASFPERALFCVSLFFSW